MIEPAREQNREPPVAVAVRRGPEPSRDQWENPVVERIDDVSDRRVSHRVEILACRIHLDATADAAQHRRHGDVVARAVGVAVADEHVEHTFPRRSGARVTG